MTMAAPVVENLFLGQRIRDLANESKLLQSTIARRIGVHESIISLWARNQRPVPISKIDPLAAALEATVPRLLPGGVPDAVYEHMARMVNEEKLPERIPPVEPTPVEPPAKTPPLDWQPHVQHPYAPLVPTLPMSGRRPVVKGRLMQSYSGVGRIADL